MAKLKKAQIAIEAERLATGTCWLPQMLAEPFQVVDGPGSLEKEDQETA